MLKEMLGASSLASLAIMLCVTLSSAGKTENIQCSTCHPNLSEVLPKDHADYTVKSLDGCFECHKASGKAKALGSKIHATHMSRDPDLINQCFSCHVAGGDGVVLFPGHSNMRADRKLMLTLPRYFSTWIDSSSLANYHKKAGVSCLDCHATYVTESAAETQVACIGCHGDYNTLIPLTDKTRFSANPHKAHYVDLRCSLCHKGHEEFKDFCKSCHQFNFNWKQKP